MRIYTYEAISLRKAACSAKRNLSKESTVKENILTMR